MSHRPAPGDLAARPEEILARPALARLWAKARERLERRGGVVGGAVAIDDPRPDERDAIAALLGWRRAPHAPLRVRLDVLDRELQASRVRRGLVEVLESLGGPLADLPAERAAARAGWDELWGEARAHPASADPAIAAWLGDLRSTGLLKRIAPGREREMLLAALGLVARLPAADTRLSILAGEAAGDSHALDPGRPLATLVLRCLAARAGRAPPASAEDRRLLWAEAGVLAGDVSSDVLALNLPAPGGGPVHRWLREFSGMGEPVRLTLRQIAAAPVRLEGGRRVFACENPTVVAEAADRLGPSCSPLVCVEGMPTTAALLLLEQLDAGGAAVAYHGDFDWGGLRAGNSVFRRIGAEPWRYTTRRPRAGGAGRASPAPPWTPSGTPGSVGGWRRPAPPSTRSRSSNPCWRTWRRSSPPAAPGTARQPGPARRRPPK